MTDTIAAIATGNTLSAIGIIRISGPEAIACISALFRSRRGISPKVFKDRKLYYGEVVAQDRVLDNCLCTVSRGPNSYTGEDTAELQCHGSPVVLAEILKALCSCGARHARAGEFTKRAFINGKMDLIQAEAVIDLINAETAEAAANAAGQLAGAVSKRTDAIYDSLTDIMAHFHAVLDYSDEDIEPFQIRDYTAAFEGYTGKLMELEQSFARGSIMKNGIKCAIIGKPNAGKSSLLNALLGYERAIVTEIPGTTRDTIEERVRLGGILLRITDTAGLRETEDPVERLGVERSRAAASEARLLLAVFDGSSPLDDGDRETLVTATESLNSIAIINKNDLPQVMDRSEIADKFKYICEVSSLGKTGLEALERTIEELFGGTSPQPAGEILTNARHYDAVRSARESLEGALTALKGGLTPDAVLTEIEDAMEALGELTGKTVREDITARIFERFCVGK